MNTENQRLRAIFEQVKEKYRALQMHVYQVLNHQQNPAAAAADADDHHHEEEIIRKQRLLMIPKEFMGLGQLDIGINDHHRPSKSNNNSDNNSGGGDQNRENNNDENNKKNNNNSVEDGGGDQEWSPNKTPRLLSNDIEQANEATMRKARVSVRARSEAPMVRL